MPDYANGKIYCIRNRADNDKIVYVGSTTQTLANRMSEHRQDVAKKQHHKFYAMMARVGVANFYIELIEDFPCERREQLTAEEGRRIRMHNTLSEGGNYKMEGRTPKEYYEENKTKLLQQQKEYMKDPIVKEKKKAYHKEYNEKNKEEIREERKEWYALHKAEQNVRTKTNYEQNKERYLAQCKAYKQAHKAEIAAKNKAYNERKKELKNQALVNGGTENVS